MKDPVEQIRTHIPALSAARSAQPGAQVAGANVPPPYAGPLLKSTRTVTTSAPVFSISSSASQPLVSNPPCTPACAGAG